MTQAEMKSRLIKELDRLNPELLSYFYQFFMDMLSRLGNSSEISSESDSMTSGDFSTNDQPSDFSGIWESPVPNANEIRKKAWETQR